MNVLYTAAHSGFDLSRVPLGGGAAVCQHLASVWAETRPFALRVIGPEQLPGARPVDADLVRFSEMEYARFCRAFERKSTELIFRESPHQTVVLCNDVSEGPDFRSLAAAGYALFTIYHVDVVDYISRVYLHSLVKPSWLSLSYAALEIIGGERLLPDVFKLIVQKQQDSVRYSRGLIVPSAAMKDVLMRCYPDVDPAKIHVLPWGIWKTSVDGEEVTRERERLRRELALPDSAPVLLTLSRISPEKGQDRLLKALALWESSGDYPDEGVVLLVAGEAAYMQGRRFEKKLRRLAARLRRTRVHFVGYASGARKQALFETADLYVFPSRHESYGLTLLEAMQAGLPALACDDHGTRDLMIPGVGTMLPPASERDIPRLMRRALAKLLSDSGRLQMMGNAAQAWAGRQSFPETAARLADLLKASAVAR